MTTTMMIYTSYIRSGIAQWYSAWLLAGWSGVESRQELGMFLFITASTPALGPTQPPIQWERGNLSLGVKRPVREADHSHTSSAEVKECSELYIHSPNTPSWCGAQVEQSAGISLCSIFFCSTWIRQFNACTGLIVSFPASRWCPLTLLLFSSSVVL
jgi:hypothetical protein